MTQIPKLPLNPRQKTAAELLGKGFSPAELAEALGCSRSTITVWRRHPDFSALVEKHRKRWSAQLEADLQSKRPDEAKQMSL